MQTIRKIRQNLSVDVRFMDDGSMMPLKIHAGDRSFSIERVTGCRKRVPDGVGSIAPTEYTVIVDGYVKRIYYEQDSNTWFSVRVCVE